MSISRRASLQTYLSLLFCSDTAEPGYLDVGDKRGVVKVRFHGEDPNTGKFWATGQQSKTGSTTLLNVAADRDGSGAVATRTILLDGLFSGSTVGAVVPGSEEGNKTGHLLTWSSSGRPVLYDLQGRPKPVEVVGFAPIACDDLAIYPTRETTEENMSPMWFCSSEDTLYSGYVDVENGLLTVNERYDYPESPFIKSSPIFQFFDDSGTLFMISSDKKVYTVDISNWVFPQVGEINEVHVDIDCEVAKPGSDKQPAKEHDRPSKEHAKPPKDRKPVAAAKERRVKREPKEPKEQKERILSADNPWMWNTRTALSQIGPVPIAEPPPLPPMHPRSAQPNEERRMLEAIVYAAPNLLLTEYPYSWLWMNRAEFVDRHADPAQEPLVITTSPPMEPMSSTVPHEGDQRRRLQDQGTSGEVISQTSTTSSVESETESTVTQPASTSTTDSYVEPVIVPPSRRYVRDPRSHMIHLEGDASSTSRAPHYFRPRVAPTRDPRSQTSSRTIRVMRLRGSRRFARKLLDLDLHHVHYTPQQWRESEGRHRLESSGGGHHGDSYAEFGDHTYGDWRSLGADGPERTLSHHRREWHDVDYVDDFGFSGSYGHHAGHRLHGQQLRHHHQLKSKFPLFKKKKHRPTKPPTPSPAPVTTADPTYATTILDSTPALAASSTVTGTSTKDVIATTVTYATTVTPTSTTTADDSLTTVTAASTTVTGTSTKDVIATTVTYATTVSPISTTTDDDSLTTVTAASSTETGTSTKDVIATTVTYATTVTPTALTTADDSLPTVTAASTTVIGTSTKDNIATTSMSTSTESQVEVTDGGTDITNEASTVYSTDGVDSTTAETSVVETESTHRTDAGGTESTVSTVTGTTAIAP